MPFTEMVVTVALFSAITLGGIHLLRLVGAAILHGTVRKAIDKDPQAAEPLLAKLSAAPDASGDDRTAVLLVAFGVAMVAASLIISDPNWVHYGIAGAIFPLVIGTALWLRHFVINRSPRTNRAEQQ